MEEIVGASTGMNALAVIPCGYLFPIELKLSFSLNSEFLRSNSCFSVFKGGNSCVYFSALRPQFRYVFDSTSCDLLEAYLDFRSNSKRHPFRD